ncbi:MAG: flippase-like domain-containing protein [Bacteroides sp.]|nr:flippase-like domain-containing protein [Bacteroides sp.]
MGNDNDGHALTPKTARKRLGGYLLKYGIPLVISVGLCWLLFHNEDINPTKMWEIIRTECNFGWIALNIVFGLLAQVFRAARWRIQLSALDIRPSFWQLVLSIFGTYSVNLVFPRLGEVWRTGYIAGREKAPFTTVFGSMVADRLADTITVFILLLLTFIPAGSQLKVYLGQDGGMVSGLFDVLGSPILWGAVAATMIVICWLFMRFPEHRIIVAVRRIWSGLWSGFAVVAKMRGKGTWLLYTLLLWGSYIMALYCALRSFPLTAEMMECHGLASLAVCFVFTSISMGVPSNGGIGPYQWAMIFGITLFSADIPGLTREYSLTFANFLMGVQTLVLIIQGFFTFGCIALSKRQKK